ncbi:hypothetical protein [Sphingobacterium wenxiniae]|uniref:hypothetical protein n=1 Tax=Sphingobacterium wenxiniae TaxID=683125 RepID=UPI00111451E0|nr:hypothetical protein [Sphingobacterium wenxiniae]
MRVKEDDFHHPLLPNNANAVSVPSQWRKDNGNPEGLCGRERHGNYCPKQSKRLRTVVSAFRGISFVRIGVVGKATSDGTKGF